MKINYTHSAISDLSVLPEEIQKRIAKKMKFYSELDEPLKFAEHLTDFKDAEFRFRIGEYRILFDVAGKSIFVLKIRHRKDIYK
ncbi:MAG: type II toxin-antitoxin system RelE/ParE family toxin [Minisyncoccia bacterium]